MHQRALPIIAAVALFAPVIMAETESELTFADLRLQGGVTCTNGVATSLTLMCGDLGDKDQHVVDAASDFGIVLGIRFRAANLDAKLDAGPTVSRNLLEGVGLLGIGYYAGPTDHLELAVGYGLGETSHNAMSSFSKDGKTKVLLGELGWYHTMAKHFQFGVSAGFTVEKLSLDAPAGGAAFDAKAQGLDASVGIGYRF